MIPLRSCDVCGTATRDRARPLRSGPFIPRCVPCRIATKSCSIMHQAGPPDDRMDEAIAVRIRTLYTERTKLYDAMWNLRRRRPTGSARLFDVLHDIRTINAELSRLRNEDRRRFLWASVWFDAQIDSNRISDDPAFIARLLEARD